MGGLGVLRGKGVVGGDKVLVAECYVANAGEWGDSDEASEARQKPAGEANLEC